MGLLHRLSASPQCAIAQVESAATTESKARMAAPNSNEWSSATARSIRGVTADAHEVGKCTVPSFSVAWPAGWLCAAAGAAASPVMSAITERANGARVMSEHLVEVRQDAAQFSP